MITSASCGLGQLDQLLDLPLADVGAGKWWGSFWVTAPTASASTVSARRASSSSESAAAQV